MIFSKKNDKNIEDVFKDEKQEKIDETVEKNKKINIDFNKIKALMNVDIKDISKKFQNNRKKIQSVNKKKITVVAFDVGSNTIKIVEGSYHKGELVVNKVVKSLTPKECIEDGKILNNSLLSNELKRIMRENSIHAKYGVCTNNSTTIINREILIPKVEDEEIQTVVRFEIQQYLPINLDDYVFQVTKLSEDEENNKLNVRVIAYPDKIARGYYDMLRDMELKPYALDVNYNSLNKLANYFDQINGEQYDQQKSVVFIDMGASSLDVNIYSNGILQFTRIIKAGGNYLDEILIRELNINKEDLVKYKSKQVDLLDIDSQDKSVLYEIDDWIEKIEKIIQFYRNKNMGIDIDNIFIYGGSAKLKGLCEYMTSKLSIDTELIENISNVHFNSKTPIVNIYDYINVIGSIIRLE